MKSGTDFREFSEITISFSEGPVQVCIDRVEVQSSMLEDVKVKDLVGKFQRKLYFMKLWLYTTDITTAC